ncbi:MAG TPA: DUF4097 family beta strand repeat-containing protein [Steroidobacteraceae bacterium]|nr:DUF4097 family beta strand repeat-containing protein [Steroidobacteraceae bacterium]
MSKCCTLPVKIIVLCAIFVSAGCTYTTGTDFGEYSQSFPVNGRADVHIEAYNARVRVLSTDDSKVGFRVRYERDQSQPSNPYSARQDGSVIELTERRESHDWWSWGNFNSGRAEIEVRMPKNADLQLQTSNGAIEVTSLNGNIRLHTSNGAITADSLKGKVQAQTSNGAISVEGVDGDCELGTSNGRIQVSGRFDSLNLRSSNGVVVAHAQAGSTVASRWSIGTSNAPVDLTVPTALKADLDVGTSNGPVNLELPVTLQGYEGKSHLHGTLNGGGQEVSVHTSNGPIHVSGV